MYWTTSSSSTSSRLWLSPLLVLLNIDSPNGLFLRAANALIMKGKQAKSNKNWYSIWFLNWRLFKKNLFVCTKIFFFFCSSSQYQLPAYKQTHAYTYSINGCKRFPIQYYVFMISIVIGNNKTYYNWYKSGYFFNIGYLILMLYNFSNL